MFPRAFSPRALALSAAISAAVICGCKPDRDAAGNGAPAKRDAAGPAGRMPAEEGNGGLLYAKGFALRRSGETTMVDVHKPWQGATSDFTYRLVPRKPGDTGASPALNASNVFAVPVRRVVTLTTTNLLFMQSLGALDALVGVGGARYICNPAVLARLHSGAARDVGEDVQLDAEAVVALHPDVIFTFVVGGSSDGGLGKLAEAGLSAVIEGSYMEESPLGRAEWIKFAAAFLDRRAAADSIFAAVDSSYRALAALAKAAKTRPTVFTGAPFGGAWWTPSGRTYPARLLADAGADYLWASDTTAGSLNLDMESVLARASRADFWLNAGDWADLADAKAKEPRAAYFRALQEGNVYVNDAIKCGKGGRDYFETGAARPDWILADLISIFHPELLPDHKLRWYRKLGPAEAAK